ncbi:MAG: class I SAM-dependent methyltransferase [Rivularia sp. ALOHA_DT_140]|nr:class I SAM-dependent methyltransferase [Rivularia sp. ALOHA_DT_140]
MSKFDDSQSINQTTPTIWSQYYKAVANRPPRETLLTALSNFELEIPLVQSKIAVDLGCGEGRDTVELLRRSWKVIAIDGQPEAIERLKNRCDIKTQFLETRIARFENIDLPLNVNLINASFSLPFCEPQSFPQLWNQIVSSLIPGGRLSGQLFGDRDSWADNSTMNFHTLSKIQLLLKHFEVELLKEEDHPGKTALGEEKHWHIFHIVARKK